MTGVPTLPWTRVQRSDQTFQVILEAIPPQLIDGNLNLVHLSNGWASGAHEHFLGEQSVAPMAASSDNHGRRRRQDGDVGCCQDERASGLHSEVLLELNEYKSEIYM